MNRFTFWILGAFVSGLSGAADDLLVRESEALSPAAELAALAVPEGFEIRLFASEPMIHKPINLAVDESGRVWVSSTVEYPYAAEKDRWVDAQGSRVRGSRDAIKILEDTNHDGRADRVTDFADGLNIPTGVLPWHRPEHTAGCIAWSIPNIWYFADTDGDGKCDHREVLFGPLGYEKDTHGMCSSFRLGADGWVYATHGFNNTSRLHAKDGSAIELHSGNVFRFLPDGSRVEVWSRGQVNPFGLAFDKRGHLYSADCHSAPVYQVLRGAVYPSFGEPHDGLGFGPAMITHTHGSTGIAGIALIDRGQWAADWNDHILIGNPVTSRVNLDHVAFAGTTPIAEEKADFVTSDDPWFRPVDLALGPDGALYIADFYNRIIGHYEVPLDHPGRDRERGRIWQVVKTGARTPREDFPPPVPPLDLVAALGDPSPWVKRGAAAALVDKPTTEVIRSLAQAITEIPEEDTHLRHALRIALRSCLSLPGSYSRLGTVGLSEIASVSLAVATPESAAWLLAYPGSENLPSDFPELRRRHLAKNGSGESLALLLEQERKQAELRDPDVHAAAILEIAEAMEERHGLLRDATVIDEMTRLAAKLLEKRGPDENELWRVRSPGPRGWEVQPRTTEGGDSIEVLSSLVRGAKGAEKYTGLLVSRPFPMPERLAFRVCGHVGLPSGKANKKNFVRLVDVLDDRVLAQIAPPRQDAAVLVEWRLPEAAGRKVRLEIVDGDDGSSFAWIAVGEIEGAELPVVEFARRGTEQELLRRLARLLVTSAPVDLRDRLSSYLPPPPPAPPLKISEEERKRLSRLIADRIATFDPAKVDLDRGKTLFATHCKVCHRIEGDGGLIGPQLEGVGSRGLERLAEDILDPNRNVDAHFRLTSLTKKDRTAIGGFVANESGELILLLDAAGQSHRVLVSEIQSREASAVSLMPSLFGDVLKANEFHDLVGWLLQPSRTR